MDLTFFVNLSIFNLKKHVLQRSTNQMVNQIWYIDIFGFKKNLLMYHDAGLHINYDPTIRCHRTISVHLSQQQFLNV